MSVIFAGDEGWVISHLQYLDTVYEDIRGVKFKFNSRFFKINSQYFRGNQIENLPKHKITNNKKRKRRKKEDNLLPAKFLEQNIYIKTKFDALMKEAKKDRLFSANKTQDGNEIARSESKRFYLDSSSLENIESFYGSNNESKAVIAEFRNETFVFPRNCQFYCYDVRNIKEKIDTSSKFDFILLDPPWWNKSIRRKKAKFEETSYSMMYNEDLAKIPIKELLSSDGLVAVWCTNCSSHIQSILNEIFPSWGLTYVTKWYWVKVTQVGETICDFNSVHGKQPYEILVIGSASVNLTNFPADKLLISIPSAAHSHKPPIIEIVKQFLPTNPKCLEIFARYLLPDWTSWGLEVLKFQHSSLFKTDEEKQDLSV